MPIYLDHNASTPPFPEVVDAMLPWLREGHANPHSEHLHGRRAAAAVEQAKASIGALVGVEGDDVILTSGATESNNLVLQGYLRGHGQQGALIHSAVEHACVMETALALAQGGTQVMPVGVDRLGRLDPAAVRAAVDVVTADRVLVSLIHANNEVGTVAPMSQIALALKGSNALIHTDASQSAGRLPVNAASMGLDFLTLSSHKIGGPAGIGAVYVAPDLRSELRPLAYGGGQQGGLRPGTIPVFLAVGYGVASELAAQHRDANAAKAEVAAEAFLFALREQSVRFELLGDPTARLPGLRSLRLLGFDAREILDRITTKVSASTGSACAAGELRSSHVLRAMGLTEQESNEVLRFGFSYDSTIGDAIDAAAAVVSACLRQMSAGALSEQPPMPACVRTAD